jgi:hypothetical protein
MYLNFNKPHIQDKIMKQKEFKQLNKQKIVVKKIAKSPYERDRQNLMRDFILHHDCDTRSYFGCNIESKILLHEIKECGSIAKWISYQSDLPQILASIRDGASQQR